MTIAMIRKKRILCFASHYLPGFRAGGPVRSLMGICDWLQGDFDFRVVTRDRDFGDRQPYPDKTPGRWYPVNGALVWYLSPPYWAPSQFRRIVLQSEADLIYLQSFLDPALAIMPLMLKLIGVLPRGIPVLIAPRGQFSPSALALKHWKKDAYIYLFRAVGACRDVIWHATDAQEAAYLRSCWGPAARILIAPNLPPKVNVLDVVKRPTKRPGFLRIAFLSRICPMKNLTGALESLISLTAEIEFDVHGPKEDLRYWAECEAVIRRLPANVRVRYLGVVAPQDVLSVLSSYHVFFLPSLGENFGHVILEALIAGCPIVLSDRTPWRHLSEDGVGYDVPLTSPDLLSRAIEKFATMDDPEFQTWSLAARQYGLDYCHNEKLSGATKLMLETAMGENGDQDEPLAS